MDYSLEQCKKDMCQMWKWLSENPTKDKCDFYKLYPEYEDLIGECAACKYNKINDHDNCGKCPVNWGSPNKYLSDFHTAECCDDSSFYEKWDCANINSRLRAIYAKEVYKLALQIRV